MYKFLLNCQIKDDFSVFFTNQINKLSTSISDIFKFKLDT